MNDKEFKQYLKIPATVIPDKSYTPVLIDGIASKYIIKEDLSNPYNSILYPRDGIGYDINKGFTSNINGNISIYKDNKKRKVDMIELLEENQNEIENLKERIQSSYNKILLSKMEDRLNE